MADYSEAIRLNPDYALAYNNRGFAYEKKGERDLAIADYRKAVELGNERARGHLERLGVEP
ncbi:MAG: tetratricopeptide repeat protein [Ardenticatenaceae bacterium]